MCLFVVILVPPFRGWGPRLLSPPFRSHCPATLLGSLRRCPSSLSARELSGVFIRLFTDQNFPCVRDGLRRPEPRFSLARCEIIQVPKREPIPILLFAPSPPKFSFFLPHSFPLPTHPTSTDFFARGVQSPSRPSPFSPLLHFANIIFGFREAR
ncbi:hypothetical protein VTG60DRAFT_2870 [Thermothelomyces hinnuleus]